MFHIVANLDQEERWLGTPMPRKLQLPIAKMSGLLSALAPADEPVTIWTCVNPLWGKELGPLEPSPHWEAPTLAVGTPPDRVDLVWAQPAARAYNDRRFALRLSHELGCALPGAREVASIGELEAHLAAGGAATGRDETWVVKAPWSSAGRHRAFTKGNVIGSDTRVWLERMFAKGLTLCFEPYMHRICDVAVCGVIGDEVRVDPPHAIVTDLRGAFRGIDLVHDHLTVGEHDQLIVTGERVAHALQQAGYRGRFGVDAFVYDDAGNRRLHPLCEINARYTFGHVAKALGQRFGTTRFGLTRDAPPGGRVLMAQEHVFTAWVA